MAIGSFNDQSTKEFYNNVKSGNSSSVVVGFFGIAAFFLGLMWLPLDLVTTAEFQENVGVKLIGETPVNLSGIIFYLDGVIVPLEGLLFSLTLAVGQVIFQFRMQTTDSWVNGKDYGFFRFAYLILSGLAMWIASWFTSKRTPTQEQYGAWQNMNADSIMFLGLFICVSCFDWYTGFVYRYKGGPYFDSMAVSFLDNAMPEFMMVEGFKYFWTVGSLLLFPKISKKDQDKQQKPQPKQADAAPAQRQQSPAPQMTRVPEDRGRGGDDRTPFGPPQARPMISGSAGGNRPVRENVIRAEVNDEERNIRV